MMRDDEQPLLPDQCNNMRNIPVEGLAAGLPMLDLLAIGVWHRYLGDEVLRTTKKEELLRASKCLMVTEGSYAKLIAKVMKIGIVGLVYDKPKAMIGLFGVQKDED